MERRGPHRSRDQGCFYPMDMSARVTQITKFHQLAEAESLLGDERRAKSYRNAAVSYGICVITLTELNKEQKKALKEALEWLKGRDCEMHKTVIETLEEARAKRELAKSATRVRRTYGNLRHRAA